MGNNTILENAGANGIVGALSTTDVDAGDTFTYTLVAGTGDTDNATFNINSNDLRATASLDYETKSSYTVRVRSTDLGGLYTEQQFTVTVLNGNEAPTVLSLGNSTIPENSASNTVVGALSTTDADAGDTFTYTLVAGTGDTDNASFNINLADLRATAAFDFETKASYSVLVRTTDLGGLFTEQQFTVSVTNVNEIPTDLAASSVSIAEGLASGTTVGILSSTDPDAGDTFTYTLVAGTGDTDNASFAVATASVHNHILA